MANSKGIDLIKKVALQINDEAMIRWTKLELISYLNDAVKAVCLRRPDAYTIKESFVCVAGTEQQTPTDAITLLDVIRNNNGAAIRGPHDTLLLDNYRPSWRESTGNASADTYLYDERNPSNFYLYPGVSDGHVVVVVCTKIPNELTESDIDGDSTVDISQVYDNPIVDWMIYRAFNKDAEYTANGNRAQLALNAFKTALGEKNQADNATFTSNREENKKMK